MSVNAPSAIRIGHWSTRAAAVPPPCQDEKFAICADKRDCLSADVPHSRAYSCVYGENFAVSRRGGPVRLQAERGADARVCVGIGLAVGEAERGARRRRLDARTHARLRARSSSTARGPAQRAARRRPPRGPRRGARAAACRRCRRRAWRRSSSRRTPPSCSAPARRSWTPSWPSVSSRSKRASRCRPGSASRSNARAKRRSGVHAGSPAIGGLLRSGALGPGAVGLERRRAARRVVRGSRSERRRRRAAAASPQAHGVRAARTPANGSSPSSGPR